MAKLSGPLLDRIDIHIELAAVKYKEHVFPPMASAFRTDREAYLAGSEFIHSEHISEAIQYRSLDRGFLP